MGDFECPGMSLWTIFATPTAGGVAFRGRRCAAHHSPGASGRTCAIMTGMDTRFLGIAELVEAPSVAVVVDVMRAFTVAAWALAQGRKKSFLLSR